MLAASAPARNEYRLPAPNARTACPKRVITYPLPLAMLAASVSYSQDSRSPERNASMTRRAARARPNVLKMTNALRDTLRVPLWRAPQHNEHRVSEGDSKDRVTRGPSPALAAVYAAASIGTGAFYAFNNFVLPPILKSFGAPDLVIGLLSSTRSIEGAVIQPTVGSLSARL